MITLSLSTLPCLRRGYAHQLRAHEFGFAVDDADFELGARFSRPVCSVAVTLRLRFTMAGMSALSAHSPVMPNSASRPLISSTSADERRVLVGMQPVCRHVPRVRPFHERHFYPAFAAANAAE